MDKMLLFSTTIQGCPVDKNKLAAKELLPLKITFFPYCFIIFMHVHFSPFFYSKIDLQSKCYKG